MQRVFVAVAILTEYWIAEAWQQIKAEIPRVLAERSRIRRAGWFGAVSA